MDRRAKHLYVFGQYRFDPEERLLSREGTEIPLSPKLTELLFTLVHNAGHLVAKEELMKEVWPDACVEDGNLNKNVSLLRKTLGQWNGGREYIETVPKAGYRFVVSVDEIEESENPNVLEQPSVASLSPDSADRKSYGLLVFSAVVLIAGLTALAFHFYGNPRPKAKDTLVLGDFSNTTGDNEFDLTLNQTLRTKFLESNSLNVLPAEIATETLLYMGHSPEDHITPMIAREICLRRGLKATISGSIATVGRDYVIGLDAQNCRTGDLLAKQQVQTHGKEDVLRGLDRAALELRAQLDKVISSIQNNDLPLEQVTTTSIEALQAYSLAQQKRASGADRKSVV